MNIYVLCAYIHDYIHTSMIICIGHNYIYIHIIGPQPEFKLDADNLIIGKHNIYIHIYIYIYIDIYIYIHLI
jgi:hypothetical protein